MRALLWVVMAVLCVAGTAHAADAFSGNGPIPVRNFQPVQLIFLNLPFERARVQPRGGLELHMESAESNEIATNQDELNAVLKFETNRTVFGGSVGVTDRLQLGLDVPFVSRYGGFLDPFIDAIESATGTTNPERRLFPQNSFGAFQIRRGRTTLFHGGVQYMELGDVWGSAKYALWDQPDWPLVSLRAAVKAPTGRAGATFGSGKPDVGAGVAAEQQFLPWLVAYGNFDVIYPTGPITPARLTLNPFLIETVAGEARLWRQLSFLLQQELYTSPLHGLGTRLLNGTAVEMTAGFKLAVGPMLVQFGVIDNVSPVATTADFSVLLRLSYRRS